MMIKKQLSRILSITLLCALGLYSCAGDEGEVVLETSGEETTTDAASEYTKPELDCGCCLLSRRCSATFRRLRRSTLSARGGIRTRSRNMISAGCQYTVSGDICFFAKSAPVVNFVNKQMLEDYSLDDPYQLVRDGRWTLDKMKEMTAAASHDLNGNGDVDVDDSFGFMNEPSSVSYFMIGFGIDYSTRGSDDSIELSFYSDRAATAIEKLVPFMRDRMTTLYAQDYVSVYSSPYEELFQPTFMSNRALFYSNQLLLALDFRNMDADFGILPLPKLDESQPRVLQHYEYRVV